ncbi:MAG: TonB C-terminal domain-containing protein [Betaproteobacteria bacterium]|nr:TonB C-terminal domain-containing protein [Betaproteobacteria bacterium]MBI2959889.1 TonB C-terminal domain-containing protein [Betaproteobacteria bacterium]
MAAVIASRDPGATPAVALSLLVHAILFGFLVFGVHWVSRPPEAVVVELWDRPPAIEQREAPPKVEVKPEPKPEPKPKPAPEPKAEPKPSKPDIALEKAKKAPPKKEEPPLKLDRAQDLREQVERELAQVERELKNRAAPQKAAPPPAGPLVDASYANKIKAKIKSNIVLPPDISGNPEAIFDVVQLPNGEVMNIRLRKSSGHRRYDEAVERAILKSSPLPMPDRREQFQRDLQLKFRPQE